jgi:hypothetical protein
VPTLYAGTRKKNNDEDSNRYVFGRKRMLLRQMQITIFDGLKPVAVFTEAGLSLHSRASDWYFVPYVVPHGPYLVFLPHALLGMALFTVLVCSRNTS